jgi:CDP-diacylglycerol--serine O-phosphatidyltransferase
MTEHVADVERRTDGTGLRRAMRRFGFLQHRRHPPHRRRRIPPLSVMPTLFTLGNLVAGFAAIHYASKPLSFNGPWGWSSLTLAGALVFLGMFLDSVDGSVARLVRSTSGLGAQLDSLADMVTFGVAPAYMMLQLVSHYVGPLSQTTIIGPDADNAFAKILWGVAAVYVCCTALRLARFNVETPSARVEDHLVFRGLPSPGAAGTVASLIIMHQHWLAARDATYSDMSQSFARVVAFGIPLVTLMCALAMVSSIPYTHMTNRYVRGARSFKYVVRVVIVLAVAVWWPQAGLAVIFTAYAMSGPVRMVMHWLRTRGERAARTAAQS